MRGHANILAHTARCLQLCRATHALSVVGPSQKSLTGTAPRPTGCHPPKTPRQDWPQRLFADDVAALNSSRAAEFGPGIPSGGTAPAASPAAAAATAPAVAPSAQPSQPMALPPAGGSGDGSGGLSSAGVVALAVVLPSVALLGAIALFAAERATRRRWMQERLLASRDYSTPGGGPGGFPPAAAGGFPVGASFSGASSQPSSHLGGGGGGGRIAAAWDPAAGSYAAEGPLVYGEADSFLAPLPPRHGPSVIARTLSNSGAWLSSLLGLPNPPRGPLSPLLPLAAPGDSGGVPGGLALQPQPPGADGRAGGVLSAQEEAGLEASRLLAAKCNTMPPWFGSALTGLSSAGSAGSAPDALVSVGSPRSSSAATGAEGGDAGVARRASVGGVGRRGSRSAPGEHAMGGRWAVLGGLRG
jgi:hypothetical protein